MECGVEAVEYSFSSLEFGTDFVEFRISVFGFWGVGFMNILSSKGSMRIYYKISGPGVLQIVSPL